MVYSSFGSKRLGLKHLKQITIYINKMKSMIVLLAALVVMATARPDGGYSREYDGDDHSYEFQYQVQDESEELDFGHKEEKSGDRVEGYYYVLLPDERMQKVEYYVEDDSGFVAEVTYSGEADFDEEESYEYGKGK